MTAGRRGIPKRRRAAIRERVSEVVRAQGGRERAAKVLGVAVRTIEGWLAKTGTGAPDTNAVMRFAEEAHINPQWLLCGTGPKHFNESRTPTDLAADVQSTIRARLIARGFDGWYLDRYLPNASDLLDRMVETADGMMEERRNAQRVALASAIQEALERGAAGGWGPILAAAFAKAFHEAQGGTHPPNGVVVDPIFSNAIQRGDAAAEGRLGSHSEIRAGRRKR